MEEYRFLLDLALILAATKILGLFSRKINMPPVVGALLAGVLLGPVVFHVIQPSGSISNLAEVGVVVLMFQAGLETDLKELKRSGKAAFIIAACGVVLPFAGGALVAHFYNTNVLENLFIGVILTATSVSITVEALQDMGRLKGRAGTAILGAAIIDDVLGIVLLSVMTSVGRVGKFEAASVFNILGKMAIFFVIAALGGFFVSKLFWWMSLDKAKQQPRHVRRVPVLALSFCLFLAFFAELFGIADITGAYLAGIILCRIPETYYVHRKIETLSYMLITPVFFANIGITTDISGMNGHIIMFTVILCVVAVLTKIVGCGAGALFCKYSKRDAAIIGSGMVCRGEVALIVAQKGIAVGILTKTYFAPVVVMVLVTTFMAPILLKMVFSYKKRKA